MNIAPKARFLEQKALQKQFLDTVVSESFLRATEYAMLELIREPDITPEHIKGADRFLEILRNLPEEAKPLPARPRYGINHDLK